MVRFRRKNLTNLTLGDGGHFRLGARPPKGLIGFSDPVYYIYQETIKAENQGTSTVFDINSYWAGVVDVDPGDTVSWQYLWEPLTSEPAPAIQPGAEGYVGSVKITYSYGSGHYDNLSAGRLTLWATINGVRSANTLFIVSGTGSYSPMAWGPV